MKRAIHQIAMEIIKEHGRAMTAQEVYQIMVDRNLYRFNAKNPATVVRSQLRRHSKNNESKNKAGEGVFVMHPDGKFGLT